MNIGQTRVEEIDRKTGFYCYIFCENFQELLGLAAACTIFITQIAPGDSNVGFRPICHGNGLQLPWQTA
jgi:hypothetical protein